MTRMTITLPEDQAAAIRWEARRRGTSVSNVVRICLTEVLGSDETPREVPWAGLFHDSGMTPARRLDEELKESWADDIDRRRR